MLKKSMWKNTRMIILTALSAAIYAAFLIVFKAGIVIVPGITSSPGERLPTVFRAPLRPGAWGAAIGNTIGDLLRWHDWPELRSSASSVTFSWASSPTRCGAPRGASSRRAIWRPTSTGTRKKVAAFEIVAFVASAACGIVIAWYLDLVQQVPFAFLALVITFNNFAASVVLGPILLALLYPRVKRWGLLWTDIMDESDVAVGFAKGLGAILMVVASVGGLIFGVLAAVGLAGQQMFGFAGESGKVAVWLVVLPFLVLLVIASFMLSGREQFEEVED